MQSDNTSFIHPENLWREVGLRAGQSVAHFGCGPGFYLIPAAKLVGTSGKVIGVDLLPDLLAEAENRATRAGVGSIVHTIRANLELPNGSTLPNQSTDWVLLANILHQSDPGKLLLEAARVVASAGSVLLIEWDTVATPLGPPHRQRVAQTVAVQAAVASGLIQDRAFAPSPYHYGLVFKLPAA